MALAKPVSMLLAAGLSFTIASQSAAQPNQAQSQPLVMAKPVETTISELPLNTLVMVTPATEITSKKMKEGTKRQFLVVQDIIQDGVIVIPRGSTVEATVTWRTGKGILGKSAKFELSFDWVRVDAQNWRLRGKHRQEGRGNTAGALLGATFITGRSAIMVPGQVVNVFTAEPIPFQPARQGTSSIYQRSPAHTPQGQHTAPSASEVSDEGPSTAPQDSQTGGTSPD